MGQTHYLLEKSLIDKLRQEQARIISNVDGLLMNLQTRLTEALSVLRISPEQASTKEELIRALDIEHLNTMVPRRAIDNGHVVVLNASPVELFYVETEAWRMDMLALVPFLQYDVDRLCVEGLTELLGRNHDTWLRFAACVERYDQAWVEQFADTLLQHVLALQKLRRGLLQRRPLTGSITRK